MSSHPSTSASVSARKRQEPECCTKQACVKVSVLCLYRKPRARRSPRAPGHCPWSWASLTSTDTQAARGPRPVAQVSLAFPAAVPSPGEENTVPARGRKPATRAAAMDLREPCRRANPKEGAPAGTQGAHSAGQAAPAPARNAPHPRTRSARHQHWPRHGLYNLFLGPPCPGASLGLPHAEPEAHAGPGLHTHTARGPSTACREAGGFAAEGGWCALAPGKVLKPWVGGAGATPRRDPAPNPQQPNSHPATEEPDMRSGSHGGQLLGGNLQALCSRPHSPVFTRVSSETPLPGGHLHL